MGLGLFMLGQAVSGINSFGRAADRSHRNAVAQRNAWERSEKNQAISVFRQFCKQVGFKVTRVDYNWCALEIPGQPPVTVGWEEAVHRASYALRSIVIQSFAEVGITAYMDNDGEGFLKGLVVMTPGYPPVRMRYDVAVDYLKRCGGKTSIEVAV